MGKGICPNVKHDDWIYARKYYDRDTVLFMYDWLGSRIPSEKEIDAMVRGAKLSQYNNQRVWDVENAEKLIDDWETVDGKATPIRKEFTAKKLDDKIMELRKKYHGQDLTIGKGWDGKTISISDDNVVTKKVAQLHVVRNFQRADLRDERIARDAEAQVNINEEGDIIPNVSNYPQEQRDLNQVVERDALDAAVESVSGFQLYDDMKKLWGEGICNYTARQSTKELEKAGLNPFPNPTGSELHVRVSSPIGDFKITHYVSAVVINNQVYIFDMPQNEFISDVFYGKEGVFDLKTTYKPRFIALTRDEIKANYNLTDEDSARFIRTILDKRSNNLTISFKEYLLKNKSLENAEEYISLLENEITNAGVPLDSSEEYKGAKSFTEVHDEIKREKLASKLTNAEEVKVIRLLEGKLKLRIREYIPKVKSEFALQYLIKNVIGNSSFTYDNTEGIETTLSRFDEYLKSEKFIDEMWHNYDRAKTEVSDINKAIDRVYQTQQLMLGFLRRAKVDGIENTLKTYERNQQLTIRTLLPHDVLTKYKSNAQAVFMLTKMFSDKNYIVRSENIRMKTTYDELVEARFIWHKKLEKANTMLNYLKANEFSTNFLYESIANEARRKYKFFSERGQTEYSRHLVGAGMEAETYPGLEAKMAVLRKAIPFIENVIYDENIPSIAMAEAGGKTIRINPKRMTTDSIGHEYGHILIDILGGMSNSMIRIGRDQLRGTELERQVLSAYPDLVAIGDERIDKEILATAIGMKTAELFKDQEIQNKWERWLVRFLRRLRAMLGMESSVVLNLAQKLVKGQEIKSREQSSKQAVEEGYYIQGETSLYDQHSKKLEDMTSLLDEMIQSEEKFQEEAAFRLQKKYDIISKRGGNRDEAKTLEKVLPRLQGLDPTQSLLHMIRYATEATQEMNSKYLDYMAALRKPRKDQKVITIKLLSEWRNSVAAWDMLEELKGLFISTRDQVNSFGEDSDIKGLRNLLFKHKDMLEVIVGEKKMKSLMVNKKLNIIDVLIPILNEAIDIKNTMQKLYIEKGRELLTDWFFPFVNHVKIQKREEYEREWMDLPAEQQAVTPKQEYILNKLKENIDQIEADTRQLILDELKFASSDVSFLTRYLDTILDSKDVISSALARAVFGIEEKSRLEMLKWQYKYVDRVTALEKQLGRSATIPDEEFWAWMIESSVEAGRLKQNIISSLPSQLMEDYEELKRSLYSDKVPYKDNDGKLVPDSKKGTILRKWIEEHAPKDNKSWVEAQIKLYDELLAAKKITTEEHKKLSDNAKLSTKTVKRPVKKLLKDNPNATEVVDIIDSFETKNKWNFRTPSGYYKKLNTKWEAFEAMRKNGLKNGVQTDERVIFYDFIQETIDMAGRMLPGKYALSTELPSMMKQIGQRYRATASFGVFVKNEISAKFQKKSTDTDRGTLDEEGLNIIGKEKKKEAERDAAKGDVEGSEKSKLVTESGETVYLLPVYFTQNKNTNVGEKLPIQDQSFDIASLYFNYLKMAIDFQAKHEFLAEIEMANYFITHRGVIDRDGDGKINVDATHKKMRGSEKKTLRERAVKNEGNRSMNAAMVDDFIKAHIYGMEHEEEPDVNIFGFKIDRAKALDAVNRFTALNFLGMNFIAGFANLNLGEITQINEAFAGQYTNMKDLHKATAYYWKNMGGMMKDIGMRRPENVVSLLIDRFNVLNEEVNGKLNLSSRFANLMKTNTLFFTSHIGEHYMQTRFMLAMLSTMKAVDANGKSLGSMLDNISVDETTNELKINKDVANFTELDQTNFSARLHRVLSAMHGEYTKLGESAIQRYSIGRMGILFRRFVVPGFKRRWASKQPNNLLDDYTEGYYRTFGRFAKQMFLDMIHFKHEAQAAMGRTGKLKMTDGEKANMVRLMGEMAALTLAITASMFLMRAKADDDDDSLLLNNLAYQAMRLRSELMFFINPMATMQILRSPMAAMGIFESTLKLFGQVLYPVYSGTFEFDRYEQGSWKGHLKLEKTINNIIPIVKQPYRIRDIGDQLSWFQQ